MLCVHTVYSLKSPGNSARPADTEIPTEVEHTKENAGTRVLDRLSEEREGKKKRRHTPAVLTDDFWKLLSENSSRAGVNAEKKMDIETFEDVRPIKLMEVWSRKLACSENSCQMDLMVRLFCVKQVMLRNQWNRWSYGITA